MKRQPGFFTSSPTAAIALRKCAAGTVIHIFQSGVIFAIGNF
ncbi:hypothetical protein ACQCVP_12520 [Rossellomorea vietnamensis]